MPGQQNGEDSAGKLWSQIEATYKQMDTALTELECFQALQKQEVLASTYRVGDIVQEVNKQKSLEKTLQQCYGDLIAEHQRIQKPLAEHREKLRLEQEIAAKQKALEQENAENTDSVDIEMADLPVPELQETTCEEISNSVHTAPEADHTAPKAVNTASEADRTAPEADHTAPKADHTAPEAVQTVPEAIQTAPEDLQNATDNLNDHIKTTITNVTSVENDAGVDTNDNMNVDSENDINSTSVNKKAENISDASLMTNKDEAWFYDDPEIHAAVKRVKHNLDPSLY